MSARAFTFARLLTTQWSEKNSQYRGYGEQNMTCDPQMPTESGKRSADWANALLPLFGACPYMPKQNHREKFR